MSNCNNNSVEMPTQWGKNTLMVKWGIIAHCTHQSRHIHL